METVECLNKEIFALKKENQLLKVSELAIAGEYEELTEYQTSQVRFRTVFESSRLGNKIIAPD